MNLTWPISDWEAEQFAAFGFGRGEWFEGSVVESLWLRSFCNSSSIISSIHFWFCIENNWDNFGGWSGSNNRPWSSGPLIDR